MGEHRVVWWDTSILAPSTEVRTSSKLSDFLKKDDQMVRAPEGIRAHQEWQTTRRTVRDLASTPQWKVLTATSRASLSVDVDAFLMEPGAELVSAVSIEQISAESSRPHGKRFGSLVHAVLSVVALDADRDSIEKVSSLQGRILGASTEEVEAAIETVAAVIRHPTILQGAGELASNNCRREVPVTLKLQDNLMIEGVVDLAYRDDSANGVWTVVDYKTDYEIQGRVEEYSRQVWLYALAISRATGLKSRPVLLRV